jgi:hypothetical protein
LDAAGRPGLKQGPGEFGEGGEIKKEGCNEKGIRWKKEIRKVPLIDTKEGKRARNQNLHPDMEREGRGI